jgi:hypothetical protein
MLNALIVNANIAGCGECAGGGYMARLSGYIFYM